MVVSGFPLQLRFFPDVVRVSTLGDVSTSNKEIWTQKALFFADVIGMDPDKLLIQLFSDVVILHHYYVSITPLLRIDF